jgi:RNA-binding protein YhbY
MSEQQLRKELNDAYKTRALVYVEIFKELSLELGEEKAESILRSAIYKFVQKIGKNYQQYAPDNFEGLKEQFIRNIPDQGDLFQPDILRCDADGLSLEFHHCPLMEGWLEAGLSDDEAKQMCHIASIIDYGTFEGAGFHFDSRLWQRGKPCQLTVSRK